MKRPERSDQILQQLGGDDFDGVETHESDEELQRATSNGRVFFAETAQHERAMPRNDGVVDIRHLRRSAAPILPAETATATRSGCLDRCSGGIC